MNSRCKFPLPIFFMGQCERSRLLRPLIAEKEKWPTALAAMGFCFEKSGNLATAIYLYKKALALQPTKKDWRGMLENLETKSAERLQGVRKTKPGYRPVVLAVLLAIWAALIVSMVAVDEMSDLFQSIAGFRPIDYMPLFMGVAGVPALIALCSLISWAITRNRHDRALLNLKKEDLSDGPLVCRTCGLTYREGLNECHFCGTPPEAPKEQAAAQSLPASSLPPPIPLEGPEEPPPLPAPIITPLGGQENSAAQSPSPLPMGDGSEDGCASYLVAAVFFAFIGLLAGIPISYLFQPGILRAFCPMSTYCEQVINAIPNYLSGQPGNSPSGDRLGQMVDRAGNELATTAFVTMVFCAMLGVVISLIIVSLSKEKARD